MSELDMFSETGFCNTASVLQYGKLLHTPIFLKNNGICMGEYNLIKRMYEFLCVDYYRTIYIYICT